MFFVAFFVIRHTTTAIVVDVAFQHVAVRDKHETPLMCLAAQATSPVLEL